MFLNTAQSIHILKPTFFLFNFLNYWVFKHYKRMQVHKTTKTRIPLCFITFNHYFACIYIIHKIGFLYVTRLCV